MRLAIYLLLVGLVLASSILVWHVWSDNAYLAPYILGELALLAGVGSVLVAGARSRRIVAAPLALIVGGAVAYALVGPLGVTRAVAEGLLAGGNGSQSPCLVEVRKSLPDEIRQGPPPPPGVRQIGPEEARESEIRGLMGALAQSLVPFVAGAAAVVAARPSRRAALEAVIAGAAVAAYVLTRGAGAWCGQLFGLDSVVIVLAGALLMVALAVARRGRPA